MSVFLITFFFFNVGFIYEITGAPQTSISFSGGNKVYSLQSYTEAEINGVNWLYEYKSSKNYVYASYMYGKPLIDNPSEMNSQDLYGNSKLSPNSYLYLGTDLTLNNFIKASSKERIFVNFSKSDVYFEIEKSNKVYNNEDAIVILH